MNIGGIVKNSFVDYPQKISCVIFTIGCNMNCWYCHNKHLLHNDCKKLDEQEIFNFLKEHKTFLDGVVISGGEPTLQSDLEDFIIKIKKLGYLVKLDTNGTNYKLLKKLIDNKYIDYVAMDIKAPLENYSLITSTKKLDDIKSSIELLKQNCIDYEFRTTFSPDLTVSDIAKIAKGILGAKSYSIQKYEIPESVMGQDYLEGYKKEKIEEIKLCSIIKNTNTIKNLSDYNSKYNLKPLDENEFFKAKKEALKYVNKVIIKGLN